MAFVQLSQVREGLERASDGAGGFFNPQAQLDVEERHHRGTEQGYDEDKPGVAQQRVAGGPGASYLADGKEDPVTGSYHSRVLPEGDDNMVGASPKVASIANRGKGAVAEDRSPRGLPLASDDVGAGRGGKTSMEWEKGDAHKMASSKVTPVDASGRAVGDADDKGTPPPLEAVDKGSKGDMGRSPVKRTISKIPSRYTHVRSELQAELQAAEDAKAEFEGRGKVGFLKKTWTTASMASFRLKTSSQGKSKYLIDPKSRFVRIWDIVTLVFLLFTATVTPFEVAFLEPKVNALFFINRLVDFCFLTDMILNFFMPYQDAQGLWMRNHTTIITHYLRSWFLLDAMSIFPFDIINLVTESGSASNLRVLRVVRLLRLAKLLRILRAGRMFRRWESVMRIDYALVSLIKFVVITLAIAHWLACAWHLVAVLEDSSSPMPGTGPEDLVYFNWVGNYDFISSKSTAGSLYLAALYWSVATLSTLGYGDVIPATDMERVFVVVCTILGASVYAYMIGNVCGIVAGMDEKNTRFFQMMDALNAFMVEKELSQSLQERLRDYFRFRRHHSNIHDWHMLLTQMSPALRAEVSQHVHARWIGKVPVFAGSPPDLIVEIAMCLRNETYSMNEMIIREGDRADKLYIVEKGVVFVNEQIKSKGGTFGTDMIYRVMRRAYNATTLTHTVVLTLSRTSLMAILEDFPTEKKRLRKSLVRYIFRQAVLNYMRTIKRLGESSALEQAEIEQHFNDNVLHIVYDQKLRHIKRENPSRLGKIEKAVVLVQQCVRRFLIKKGEYKIKMAAEEEKMAFDRLKEMLGRVGLGEYGDALRKENVTLGNILSLGPLDLKVAVGMTLGEAVKLLDESRREADAPLLRELGMDEAARSNRDLKDRIGRRPGDRRMSISDRPIQPSRFGEGGINTGDVPMFVQHGGGGGGGSAGMAALRGGAKTR